MIVTTFQPVFNPHFEGEPIFEPEKLSMEGLFALADALRTVAEVISGLSSQPRFCDGEQLPPHGDMLQRLCEYINGARSLIHEEALKRPPETDADRRRKVFFVAEEYADGSCGPLSALCGLSRELGKLAEEARP
ncbi:hypothetical protein [Aquamicrobium sp.]|uniref:hypothetical protein n=1 Tax=Aquamicrobium sp. TaxID=1872579 RepID=UPI002585F6F4|nr:hypothetical protein [Aquamicrobium sp.]MCK9553448.1 hypothetical protein [Aquamicrobium sp.]